MIGKLQPRFHAHGSVMATAQKLEGACLKGSILISPEMSNLLQMRVNAEGVVGYTLPSPMRTHFFPISGPSTDANSVVTSSKITCCEQLLLMMGITSPKKVLSREETKIDKAASILQKVRKHTFTSKTFSANCRFSFCFLHFMRGRSRHEKYSRIYCTFRFTTEKIWYTRVCMCVCKYMYVYT